MELDKNTMRKLRQLILFAILAAAVVMKYEKVLEILGRGVGLIFPFLMGAAIAFILNVPMRGMERHIQPGRPGRWKRPLSLALSILLVAGILLLVIFVVVPELVRTLVSLQSSLPAFFERIQKQAEDLFTQYPDAAVYLQTIELDWDQIGRNAVAFLSESAKTMLSSTWNIAVSVINGMMNFFIGFVFALYILLQKETLCRQAKHLLQAFLPERACGTIFEVASLSERTFSSFLTGQCLEAVILGTMFFITLSVLRLPYALLIGVLIAFTALIPIFGAFIGCVIGAFLMLVVSPMDALVFVVVFFVLQQLEGNLIYPHVVGGSVGLPSIWVLVAVTIGGNAMGIVGMLIFIPLCSVLYTLLREAVRARLSRQAARPSGKKGVPDKKTPAPKGPAGTKGPQT